MKPRVIVALLALIGAFIALYLTLYKVGVVGNLTCSVGSCETVNTSRWAVFLGLPVAAWGLGTYLVLLALALAGVQERFESSRGISIALVLLSGWSVLFSSWLTYLELFVIEAICVWCVASAVVMLGIFVASMLDFRETRESGLGSRESAIGGATPAEKS